MFGFEALECKRNGGKKGNLPDPLEMSHDKCLDGEKMIHYCGRVTGVARLNGVSQFSPFVCLTRTRFRLASWLIHLMQRYCLYVCGCLIVEHKHALTRIKISEDSKHVGGCLSPNGS